MKNTFLTTRTLLIGGVLLWGSNGYAHFETVASDPITVTNANDAPTALALSGSSLAENAVVGTFIGTLSALDQDEGAVLTYSVSDEDNFEVQGNELVSKVEFDFETTTSYEITLTVIDEGGLMDVFTSIIEVTDDLGDNNNICIASKELESLYPNPAQNQLTVVLGTANAQGAKVQVFALNGQLVESVTHAASNNELILNVSHLPAGIYLLKVSHQAGAFHGRFVKH